MSYILDALKKSEQERGSGNIPSVQTIHTSSLNYNNKKAYWPYFLTAAVVLNLLVILYFIFDDKEKASTNNVAITQTTSTAIQEEKKQIITTDTDVKQQNNKVEITSDTSSISNKSSQQDNLQQAEDSVQINNNEIIEFYDLPDDLQRSLPSMVISAHVYSSNPLQRSIVINNNFLEEGEYILDDLILHEITMDGAIFSYHNKLIHHGIVNTWQ